MRSELKHKVVGVSGPQENSSRDDLVTVEEPLEIWVAYDDESSERVEISLSITMRTPGDDHALVMGFLFSEGLIQSREDVLELEAFGPVTEPLSLQNQLKVLLRSGESVANKNFQRYFYANSSCGVCGKASIQALQMLHEPCIEPDSFKIKDQDLRKLPEILRTSQCEFGQTGGSHAVALVDLQGRMLLLKEDIGRHNAMDKLLGQLLIEDRLDIRDKMVLVSGRASFELVQKALMADIPCFAAIGAPSSAAVDLSKKFDMTLVGFLKDTGYNIYHEAQRIIN